MMPVVMVAVAPPAVPVMELVGPAEERAPWSGVVGPALPVLAMAAAGTASMTTISAATAAIRFTLISSAVVPGYGPRNATEQKI